MNSRTSNSIGAALVFTGLAAFFPVSSEAADEPLDAQASAQMLLQGERTSTKNRIAPTVHTPLARNGFCPAIDPPSKNPGSQVTLVSVQRTSDLRNPILSTFLVHFAPGGSALLHRTPSSGYVLLYVLSGAVTASAWDAGLGTYHAGDTWAEPAFAYNIAARNASSRDSAEALVVLITEDVQQSQRPLPLHANERRVLLNSIETNRDHGATRHALAPSRDDGVRGR